MFSLLYFPINQPKNVTIRVVNTPSKVLSSIAHHISLSTATGIVLMAVSVVGCGAWSPGSPSPATGTLQVTANQVAVAMQEDRFFADYGSAMLVVRGTVTSVNHQENTVVELGTNVPTKVSCDVGNRSYPVYVGETVRVTARASDAQRAQSMVTLERCSVQPGGAKVHHHHH